MMPAFNANESSLTTMQSNQVKVTKDGVTVARSLSGGQASCRLRNIGAKLIIDASERANEECGDGTTTASLLAGYIMQEGNKLLLSSSDINPIELRRGIQKAVDVICAELEKQAQRISVED